MEQANASLEEDPISSTAQAAEEHAAAPAEENPEQPATLEDRIAALETQVARQNDLLARQMTLLEKQERRALYRKIWMGVKIALVVGLALWIGPKAYAAWMQYQAFLAQVEAAVTQISNVTGSVDSFLSDVRVQVASIAQSLSGLQDSLAPIAAFMVKLGMKA